MLEPPHGRAFGAFGGVVPARPCRSPAPAIPLRRNPARDVERREAARCSPRQRLRPAPLPPGRWGVRKRAARLVGPVKAPGELAGGPGAQTGINAFAERHADQVPEELLGAQAERIVHLSSAAYRRAAAASVDRAGTHSHCRPGPQRASRPAPGRARRPHGCEIGQPHVRLAQAAGAISIEAIEIRTVLLTPGAFAVRSAAFTYPQPQCRPV